MIKDAMQARSVARSMDPNRRRNSPPPSAGRSAGGKSETGSTVGSAKSGKSALSTSKSAGSTKVSSAQGRPGSALSARSTTSTSLGRRVQVESIHELDENGLRLVNLSCQGMTSLQASLFNSK